MLHLKLLGDLAIHEGEDRVVHGRKPLLVLALLALQPERRMHRDDVARLVWPRLTAERARGSLRQARHSLRRWCGADCLRLDGDLLVLSPSLTVDLWELEAALSRGDHHRVTRLSVGHLLAPVIRRMRGEFAREVEARATELRTRVIGAYVEAVHEHLEAGRHAEAETLARRLGQMEPLDDRSQILLVRTLRDVGRPRDALAGYGAYRTLLKSELGDEPSEPLVALVTEIRDGLGRDAASRPVGSAPSVAQGARRERRRGASRPALAVVAVAALLWLGWSRMAAPPAWATGRLLVVRDAGVWVVRPTADGLEAVDSALTADQVQPTAIADGPQGRRVIGARHDPERWPVVVSRTGEGPWTTLWDAGGDTSPGHLSPDGSLVLVAARDTSAPHHRVRSVRVDVVSGAGQTILSPPWWAAETSWSPDGRRIVAAVPYTEGPDSLFLLRPDGTRDAAWAAGDRQVQAARFCGPEALLLTVTNTGALPTIVVMDPGSRMWERAVWLGSPSTYACSPDGAYVLTGLWGSDETTLTLFDRATRQEIRTWTIAGQATFTWMPESISLPRRVVATVSEPVIAWGGRTDLSAQAFDAEDARWTGVVEWRSLAPAIAQVEGTTVVGNGPGTARLVAVANGWVTDTVQIVVDDVPGPDAWMVDALSSFDTMGAWQPLGDPIPLPVVRDGNPVLRLRGDGSYADGMISRTTFPWTQGLTVTVEFRLPLTRLDRQSLLMCFLTAEEPASADDRRWWPAWSQSNDACVRYPNHDLVRFRPNRLSVQVSRNVIELVDPGLPGDGWTQLGLQLRADRSVEVFVDGRSLGEHPLSLDPGPDDRLRVALFGRDVDTELLVRNLVVWRGPRF